MGLLIMKIFYIFGTWWKSKIAGPAWFNSDEWIYEFFEFVEIKSILFSKIKYKYIYSTFFLVESILTETGEEYIEKNVYLSISIFNQGI